MNDVERLVSAEYEDNKAEIVRTVSSKLSAAGVTMSPGDIEAPYNEAWHALYVELSKGSVVENRKGFLVAVTHRRALSEHRASRANRRASVEELDLIGAEIDFDSRLDAEIQVRQVIEGFRSNLSEREFEAATLCYIHGYSRPEAARVLGVKPKRMEKIMDGASKRISGVVKRVESGEYCDGLRSVVRAYAVGILDPDGEKYRLAQGHLENCPACRRQVWVIRGLAVGVPPLPLLVKLTSAAGAGASATGFAGVSGSAKSSGASGGAKTTSFGGKSSVVAGGAVAVAAVAIVTTVAIGGVGGDSGPSGTGRSASVVSTGASKAARTSAAASKVRKKAARAEAARVKAARQLKIRSMKRRAMEAKQAQAAVETTPAVPEPAPVVPPAPVYVPPPVVEPDPTAPKPEPDPPPRMPTTDAGEEFGLH